jgi:hypothetical protein
VFHKSQDYEAFLFLLVKRRNEIGLSFSVFAWCGTFISFLNWRTNRVESIHAMAADQHDIEKQTLDLGGLHAIV